MTIFTIKGIKVTFTDFVLYFTGWILIPMWFFTIVDFSWRKFLISTILTLIWWFVWVPIIANDRIKRRIEEENSKKK